MFGHTNVTVSCLFAGQIKETLSIELNIPIGKQELKGWASRKVTDNVRYPSQRLSSVVTT